MTSYRKTALYVALAIIAFLLFSTWQREHVVKPKPATMQPVVGQATPSVVPQSVVPSASATAAAKRQPGAQLEQGKRLIRVRTDVLDISIDPHGGNIVQAGLPKYPLTQQQLNVPMSILSQQPATYYVAQSGLTGHQGPDTRKGQVTYAAKKTSYQLLPGQNQLQVNLSWTSPAGIAFVKTYIFQRDKYVVGVQYQVHNRSSKTWRGHMYGQIQRKQPAKQGGLFHLHTFRGAALSTTSKTYDKLSYKDMREQNVNKQSQGGWLAMQQRYFLSAWVPEAKSVNHYYTQVGQNQLYTIGFLGPQLTVPAGKAATTHAQFYVGPEISKRLNAISPHLGLTVDYGWLWIISGAIFWVMAKIYSVIGNWGWSIVIVTILIKLIFYKLSETSYRSMAKLRILSPKMKQLKERFGDDKQKLSKATMELYRKEKVNPLGGCLPMIIQIPFFIALYYVLIESVQLRQAPFIFWIHDLAVRDPYFILPLLMGVSMFAQQRLTPTMSADPTQAKIMMLMPVIFTVFFASFPAGLVLYWLTNNVSSFLQQWLIIKRMEKADLKKKQRK